MIYPYKGRKLDANRPVYIYRNLSGNGKEKYSVLQNKLVVAHSDAIMIRDASFLISKSGQNRVRINKRKNVHAYVKGFMTHSGMGTCATDKRSRQMPAKIEYNPYKDETFVCKNLTTQEFAVNGAECVILNSSGVWAAYLN